MIYYQLQNYEIVHSKADRDAADGDHVGGEEGEQREGDDEIEGEGGAEIDQA